MNLTVLELIIIKVWYDSGLKTKDITLKKIVRSLIAVIAKFQIKDVLVIRII